MTQHNFIGSLKLQTELFAIKNEKKVQKKIEQTVNVPEEEEQ